MPASHRETWADLGQADRDLLDKIYAARIFRCWSPLAVDPAHPFPYISGLSLNLHRSGCAIPRSARTSSARLRCHRCCRASCSFRTTAADSCVHPAQDLISNHLDLFPAWRVLDHHGFRVTRSRDVVLGEDESENLIQTLERELLRAGSVRRSGRDH
jgi:polyphosphate kinase